MHVTVVNLSRYDVDCARLEHVARTVMKAEDCPPETELSGVIGDDVWIQKLNNTYKQKAEPTDVLAFPQETSPPEENPQLGDVALSAETAERQAKELGHNLLRELEILLTHGILHLTGWTDKTPERRRRMMARTQQLLAEL